MTFANDEALTLLPDGPTTTYEACQSAVDQRLLDENTNLVRTEREPASCSAAFLPFLAWERSVHHWTGTDATIDAARVASSFADHANYGCPSALEEEIQLDTAFSAISIREWWQVPGFQWPDFQVVVAFTPDGPTPPPASAVFASVIARKNVRDWPSVIFETGEGGPLLIGCAATLNATINCLPLDPTPHSYGAVVYGAAMNLSATIRLEPF